MVIAMVSSGVLTFVQSLGVVLGSNIGTAVGAQIISLDIKHYVAILMSAGVLGFLYRQDKDAEESWARRPGFWPDVLWA